MARKQLIALAVFATFAAPFSTFIRRRKNRLGTAPRHGPCDATRIPLQNFIHRRFPCCEDRKKKARKVSPPRPL